MTLPSSSHRTSGSDAGIAMVLSLLFMLLLSALGTAMLVLSRSETLSSVNYRMMSQARYGAESGVHKAAHFLLNSYTKPTTSELATFDITQSPVRYSGQSVVLSSLSGVTANYPVVGTQTAFATATTGSIQVGDATVLYTASATLLSMRTVIPYASITPVVLQTWRLTARGNIQGARAAEVEVSAVIEQRAVPTYTYGLFAIDKNCGAMEYTGNVTTDMYDSSNITWISGKPQATPTGGHVGTNGNLTVGGSSTIRGSLSTPRVGVGNCASGAVTAYDYQGNAQITGGIVKLPQEVVFSDPTALSPLPGTTEVNLNSSSTCSEVPIAYGNGECSITTPVAGVNAITLTPPLGGEMRLPNMHVTSGATIVLNGGVYNINSLQLTGSSKVRVGTGGSVVLNFAGVGQSQPADLENGQIINTSFNPANFRVIYAGTGILKMTGGSTTAASVYAPKAYTMVSGGADYYGAIVSNKIFFGGGSKLHRDKKLEEYFSVGPQMMSVFTWKQY
jgi:Tfp pilus assembly protein PilX